MKKLFYSKITKFIVWALILAFTVLCVHTGYEAFKNYMEKGGDTVYAFGQDFESSYYLSNLLNTPSNMVAFAYLDNQRIAEVQYYHVDGRVVSVRSEAAAVTATPTPMPTATIGPQPPATSQSGDDNEKIYSNLEERLSRLEDSVGLDYYIKINDRVYTNCGAESENELTDRNFYYLAQKTAQGEYSYESAGCRGQLSDFHSYSYSDDTYGDDSIIVCAAIENDYADEMRTVWHEQEAIVREAFRSMLVLLGSIIILVIYFIAASGKNSAGETQRGALDKLWTEIWLCIMIFGGIFAVWFMLVLLENSVSNMVSSYYGAIPEYIMTPALYITSAVGMAIVLGSFLMCVRKIKQGRFLKDSICFVLCVLCYKIAKKLICWAWHIFKTLCVGSRSFIVSLRQSLRETLGKKSGRYMLGVLTAYTALIGFCGLLTQESAIFFFLALAAFAAMAYLLNRRTRELDSIRSGAANIRRGQLSHKIDEPQSADLVGLASDINHIAQGLDESVAAKLKAERLKTELITNVSHDLKTPLTSIISYTELLSQIENMPEEAKDYIRIIASKSERLKNLTQDLFAISKVQSGNENIVFEKLDAAVLIEQSLAEHEREIESSSLDFIVRLERELTFMADGKKISRAVGNLIENILKYSMVGTRVYISAFERPGRIAMEFKNISSYQMDFDPEEIVGRFVRGDESRSTEGSGLGLAIVKSYVEACGGELELTVDGDLFKALISFEKV